MLNWHWLDVNRIIIRSCSGDYESSSIYPVWIGFPDIPRKRDKQIKISDAIAYDKRPLSRPYYDLVPAAHGTMPQIRLLHTMRTGMACPECTHIIIDRTPVSGRFRLLRLQWNTTANYLQVRRHSADDNLIRLAQMRCNLLEYELYVYWPVRETAAHHQNLTSIPTPRYWFDSINALSMSIFL